MNMPPSHGRSGAGAHTMTEVQPLQILIELPEHVRQSFLAEALTIWCPECGRSHAICTCEDDVYNHLGSPNADDAAMQTRAMPVAAGAVPALIPNSQANPHAAAGEVVD